MRRLLELRKYSKFIAMFVATVLAALAGVVTDGITQNEWLNVATAAVGAAAVFTAPNVPGARYTKQILAVLTAVLAFLGSALIGGINAAEWLQIGVIALGAAGVKAFANKTVDGVNISDTGSVGIG